MNASRALRLFALAVAAVLLPSMATATPIPGVRVETEWKALKESRAALAFGEVRPLESLWAALSGAPGWLTGQDGGSSSGWTSASPWMGEGYVSAAGKGGVGSLRSIARGGRSGAFDGPFDVEAADFGLGKPFDVAAATDSGAAAALLARVPFGHSAGTGPLSEPTGDASWDIHVLSHGRAEGWLPAAMARIASGDALPLSTNRGASAIVHWAKGTDALEVPAVPGAPAATAVPEPSALLLVGTGWVGLIAMARRRRR